MKSFLPSFSVISQRVFRLKGAETLKKQVMNGSKAACLALAISCTFNQASAQTPGPVLLIATDGGTYSWTSGSQFSYQYNAAGDSIYFLAATEVTDGFTFVPFEASTSTSAACAPAVRRVQVNAFDLVLATNNINTLSILGTSSGSSDRTLRAIFVNGTEIPAANYTITSSQTGGNAACGNITVTGLNIAPKARVTVVIGSTPSSTPQNFRVNVITVNEASLPIKLVDFKVQNRIGGRELSWTVADGNEVSSYTIERSVDGKNYETIATMLANGNSIQTYNDIAAIQGNIIYYRIKITDHDGKFTYSLVNAINIGKNRGLTLTPNPVQGRNLFVTFDGSDKVSNIKIIDAAGRVLQTTTLAANTEQANIDTYNLKPGMYFIQHTANNKVQTSRFVKL